MPILKRRYIDVNTLPYQEFDLSIPWLKHIAITTLDHCLYNESCKLSVMIVDDKTIADLNKKYRGLDEVTDILSFSPSHSGKWYGDRKSAHSVDPSVYFIQPEDGIRDLGDIVVSYPEVIRGAAAESLSVTDMMAKLEIHGILHLVGFDHDERPKADEMHAQETLILSCLTA